MSNSLTVAQNDIHTQHPGPPFQSLRQSSLKERKIDHTQKFLYLDATRGNTAVFQPLKIKRNFTSDWCKTPSFQDTSQKRQQNAVAHTAEEPEFAQIPQD